MKPGARVADMHTCPQQQPAPHVGGRVVGPGAPTVLLEHLVECTLSRREEPPPPGKGPYLFVRGIFHETEAGKDVVASTMTSGFKPPPDFAPW